MRRQSGADECGLEGLRLTNYPNMSYCAFENTNLAVQQLQGLVEEDRYEVPFTTWLNSLSSREERRAVSDLMDNMRELLETLETWQEETTEVETDGS